MSTAAGLKIIENIAVITLANPPVNALSQGLRQAISDGVDKALGDDAVKAIILVGNEKFFSAGADISEFAGDAATAEPSLPSLVLKLRQSPKPVIAALSGDAFGGGLELALGCHYRIAREGIKLGLPEVHLGILPGAGGTQLLTRLVGAETALDMIVSGRKVKAEEALDKNIVDHVLPAEGFLSVTLTLARKIATEGAPALEDGPAHGFNLRADFFNGFKTSLEKKYRGQIAPFLIVDCVKAATELSLEEGMAVENGTIIECLASPQARAQQHLFFAERAAKNVEGVAKETPRRSVERVAIIGSGTMGGGIAMAFANAGIKVTILDLDAAALERGIEAIRGNYAISVKRGRFSEPEVQSFLSKITTTTSYADLKDVDLVIEAVFENMDVKKAVFKELDEVCKPGAILATNTSTLDVNEIASATTRPEDVIGLHFFSPANVMKLLEIVRGHKTAADVIATCVDLTGAIGKVPVVVGVCYGFVGNRMLGPYTREANRLIIEGASPEQIDRVMTEFGLAMGPISMIDLAGIDVGVKVREGLSENDKPDPSTSALEDRLYALGRCGQKTSRGFYIYEGRNKTPDEEVIRFAEEIAVQHGIDRRNISDQEILERCLYPLINEGAAVLDEGIAARASDIDVIYANGYGFPKWRGGPMRFANEAGLETILEALNKYKQQLGDYGERYFIPAPLLERLAREGRVFGG